MRINAISNYGYRNNKSLNFGELVFEEKTLQTMEANLDMKETDAVAEAAGDVFSIRDVVVPDKTDSYSLKRMKEYVLLNNLLHDDNVKLKYEPFKDFRFSSTNGISAVQSLDYYALGGKFEFLSNFVPPLPKNANNEFIWEVEGISHPLKVQFVDGDPSRLKVYAEEFGHKSDKVVANTLEQFNFMPNKACPVPTKEFVRNFVANIYHYLITQNVVQMTDIDKELAVLRKKYAARSLTNFIFTV